MSLGRGESDQNCMACSAKDTDEMVCCDKCDGWYHFSCVGVTEAIADVEWSCKSCLDLVNVTNAQSQQPKDSVNNNLEPSVIIASESNRTAKFSEPSDVGRRRLSLRSKNPAKAKRLFEEMKILQEEEQILLQKEKNLAKRKELIRQMELEGDNDDVESWQDVFNTSREAGPEAESTKGAETEVKTRETNNTEGISQMRKLINSMLDRMNDLELKGNVSREQSSTSQWLPGILPEPSCNLPQSSAAPTLTREQIASRQSFAKDLPKFSGNPEDWPLFLATYQQTTEICGFCDSENLLRLKNALEGDAFRSVRNLLFHASCVPQIIETLRMKFGRPEIVLNILLKRVRDLPPIKENKLESLVDFALEVQNIVATMKSAELITYLNNPEIEQELVMKLPGLIAAFWGMHKLSLSSCNLENFGAWLFQLAQGANNVLMPEFRGGKPTKRGNVNAHFQSENIVECLACGKACKALPSCDVFKGLNRSKKWDLVRTCKLCRRCLTRHPFIECESDQLCGINSCKFLHHPLLHNKTNGVCNVVSKSENAVLFRILPVILYGNGKQVKTYAFFDDGSSLTLMEENLLRELNMKGTPSPLCIKWTADTHRYENDSQLLNLKISGDPAKKCFDLRNIQTVKGLDLPKQSLDVCQLKKEYSYLRDIPLCSYVDAEPKILIGLNNSYLGASLKTRERMVFEPVAEKNRLGWSVKGPCKLEDNYVKFNAFHTCGNSNECQELLEAVKKYVFLDNIDVGKSNEIAMSEEDHEGLNQLKENTYKVEKNYETRLLWKYPRVSLPNSLPMAKKRASCLSSKLKGDPKLRLLMDEKIKDYLEKGYAVRLPDGVRSDDCWYLPIFPVINPNKPEKIRIVWDAAAKVNGVSLNSALLKGPDLTTPLLDVLRRFRLKRFAISGDIKEMYHQVKICPEDQNYQRFLWHENGSKEPTKFALTVMSFGATCSPSTAQFIKNLNAEKFRASFPQAVNAIIDSHYVDDLLDGMDTEKEALELAKNVRVIHAEGGFTIRNWRSNSQKILEALNAEPADLNLDIDKVMGPEKVLGMWWVAAKDCVTFKVSKKCKNLEHFSGSCRPTKRQVLSTVMSIFDPLGLIGFYVAYAKVILQEIWRSGCSWDEPIKDPEFLKWRRWCQHLEDIEKLNIPRHYFLGWTPNITNMELHTFVDASEDGFAAVSFLRYSIDGQTNCSLVGSKTKVAPLKMLSIPRLELQSALLGARFAKSISLSLKLEFAQKTFWTDSKTVLSWIRSDHRKYSQFVAFRVSEILSITETNEWMWVSSMNNVADDATKWQKMPQFSESSRWFTGPEFLLTQNSICQEANEDDTIEELRPKYLCVHQKVIKCELLLKPERFSRWTRLVGATSTLLKAVRIMKCKARRNTIVYTKTQKDVISAETLIFKHTQYEVFADELILLSNNRHLQPSSSLFKLSAYLDSEGLIRMESRVHLNRSSDPIILPRNHYVTRLLVDYYHVKYLHRNHETVVNEIRQLYWIPKIRSVLKTVRKSCYMCHLQDVKPKPPKMARLPPSRLASFCRPFTHVGLDYFGPLSVVIRRSSEKRYGVLFTCLTTRAIHLEVAHSLSTESCIMAIRCFISRRGTPREWWSDNGTNFRGTERELSAAFKVMDKTEILNTFTNSYMSWNFIPPSSPHMGGSWERLVRSVKVSLSSILPRYRVTDELLRAAFAECENIVNSRPLTYIPTETNEDESLTPNHFLLGSSNGMKPLVKLEENAVFLLRGWKAAQQIADAFWVRWLREYLPTITRRTKWFENVEPIKSGDIVYIADPNNPRNCWPKGTIVTVKRGADGQVRSAFVKTATGVYERPATKIAVISLNNEVGPQKDIPGGSVEKKNAATRSKITG